MAVIEIWYVSVLYPIIYLSLGTVEGGGDVIFLSFGLFSLRLKVSWLSISHISQPLLLIIIEGLCLIA